MAGVDINLNLRADTSEVRQAAQMLQGEIEKVFSKTSGNTDKALESLKVQMAKAYEKATLLQEELSALATQQIPTEGYANLTAELEKAEQKLEDLYTKRERYEELGKRVPDSLSYDIEKAEDAVARLTRDMETMERNGKAFTLGSDTDEFARKSEQLAEVNNQMSLLVTKSKSVKSGVSQIASAFAKMGSSAVGIVSGVVQKGFSKLNERIKETKRQAQQAKRVMLAFVKAMLGVRGLYMLFRKLRSAIMEGFNNLKQFNGETIKFKDTMENFKASMSYMKNSIATSFAPLVTVVVPYLQKVADMFAELMTKVGAFFAMLTGQSTMLVAKKQTDEYGKSLNKAAGSAKKLNAELYGFDTLNKQQDKSGSGTDVSNMFEEKQVSEILSGNIKDFINELKELWANKDYYGIGAKIAEGLNSGIDRLDEAVKTGGQKLRDGAKSLAEGLNGLVEGFHFGDFGTLLADGITEFFGTKNAFLENFHFDSLGAGIAESLVSFFNGPQFEEIGTYIANKINALFSFLDGFLSNEELLPSVATAIKNTFTGFFDNIDTEKIYTVITRTINNLAVMISEIDWEQVFDTALTGLVNIVDWLINLIDGIDWAQVGEALGDVLMSIVTWVLSPKNLLTVLGNITKWILSLVSNVFSFLLGILKGIFGQLVDKFSNAGFDTITGFFQGIKDTFEVWIGAAKKWFQGLIDAVKELFGIASPSKVFGDIGGFIIEGLKKGIEDTWNKVKDGLFKTFDSLKSKVKDIFGISSPSKVFAEYGKFIDLGFVEGIEGEKSAVEQAMADMMESAQPDAEITPSLNTDNLIINLDGALARLSMIAEKFQMIADTFRVIGNVPIPALATGGVVPPNAYGSYGATSDNGLISKIQELIDRLDGGSSPVEVHAHLELDGREIYDTVVTQNNNQIQRTGTSRIKV